jgi:hypothetical protein
MPRFWRLSSLSACALLLASTAYAQRTPIEKQLPCESYSQSTAVFIGVAGAPVDRWVQLPDHPPLQMKLTPMTVERAYVGVQTPVMYVLPLGNDYRPAPGRRYLVYGRGYHPPHIVMASPPSSAKDVDAAAGDIAFLDSLMPGVKGGTISGVVQLKDRTYDGITRDATPLDRVVVRIFTEKYSTEAVTESDGKFSATVPAGTYELKPELPEGVVTWDSTSEIHTVVADGGCSVVTIDTLFNGRVRGVLRGPDGRPLSGTSVDLVPTDIEPDKTGHVKGMGSVSTNIRGEFEFAGRPPGRYYLGVGLYSGPNANGPSYPRTYYPGTTDKQSAIPVIIERGRAADGHDFSIPMLLEEGELEVVVETEYAGELTMCYRSLAQRISRERYPMRAGVPMRMSVVDGQQYEVHAHLEFSGGHLESEPFIFTATTGKTVVKLRPDAPRMLHR